MFELIISIIISNHFDTGYCCISRTKHFFPKLLKFQIVALEKNIQISSGIRKFQSNEVRSYTQYHRSHSDAMF